MPGLKVDPSRYEKLSEPGAIAKSILFTASSPETTAAIAQNSKGAPAAKIAGLVIGSPEFQRR